MKKNQHVFPHNNQWQVKGAGNTKATRVVDNQKEAINIATQIAKNQHAELLIHRPDGRIRDKESYGNDDCPPRG